MVSKHGLGWMVLALLLVGPALAWGQAPQFDPASIRLFDVEQGPQGKGLNFLAGRRLYAVFVPAGQGRALLGVRAERDAGDYADNPYGIPDNHLSQHVDRMERYYRPGASAPEPMKKLLGHDVGRAWELSRADAKRFGRLIRGYVKLNREGRPGVPLFRQVFYGGAKAYAGVAGALFGRSRARPPR